VFVQSCFPESSYVLDENWEVVFCFIVMLGGAILWFSSYYLLMEICIKT